MAAPVPILALAALLFAAPPTDAAQRRAADALLPAIVEVRGPRGHGNGVVVSQSGEVLTSSHFVALEAAEVRQGERRSTVKVLAASAPMAFAVVKLGRPTPAAAVRLDPPSKNEWLLGVVSRDRQAPVVRLGRAVSTHGPFLEWTLALPAGSAILDAQGRLVAIATGRPGRGVLLAAVKATLARAGGP
jgi:hypothetical protein